jgi:dihydrodipicolinate synthase/N-acetylneuraminate lyase
MIPFERRSLDLNLEALKENIQYAIEGGITRGKGVMIVPCGTGEYVTLSSEEHRLVVKAALDAADGKLPIVAGVSGCDHREVVKLAKSSTEAGAECVMVPPPYYYGTSQPDMVRWYRLIAREVKVGIMTYSQPWRNSGMSFTTSFIGEMASLENVVSIKTGGEQLMDYVEMLERYSKRFAFIDNSLGYTATLAHMHGAAGYITGPAAFWPELEAQYWSLLEQGRYAEADKLHTRLGLFWQFFWHGGGLLKGEEFAGGGEGAYFGASVLKAALEYVGLYGGPVRPPFEELTPKQKAELFKILEVAGVNKLLKAAHGRKTS